MVFINRGRHCRLLPGQVSKAGGTITRLLLPVEDGCVVHLLAVIDPAECGHAVDEQGGQVQSPAVLARAVVAGESVVVVVEAFANGTESDEEVLSRVDVAVIGLVAPDVRDAVDAPRDVQRDDVAHHPADDEGLERALPPVVPGHDSWQHKAQQEHQWYIEPAAQAQSFNSHNTTLCILLRYKLQVVWSDDVTSICQNQNHLLHFS